MSDPAGLPARSTWPIIVGGCPRSGTSLLRRMLDAHPRIHCGPEVWFLQDFHGGYTSDPLSQHRFMSTARSVLPGEEILEVVGAAFVTLHERAASRAAKARWADKNPENLLFWEDWGRLLGPRWLLVHTVRNPLDTLASLKEARFLGTIRPELDYRISLYLRYLERGEQFASAHPDRYYRVVYEALVADPSGVLGELMAWAGEQLHSQQLAFNESPHQEGKEDRKVGDTTEVHRDSVGRWRSLLTDEEAKTIWASTQDAWALVDPEGRLFSPAA
jgi:sulfotransferase family protein